MCGFAGIFSSELRSDAELHERVERMADTIVHRGPDDSGIWTDGEHGVAFGFRRLSIIDLSPNGHQPMVSASGRYTLVYNGEVYNHLDLRAELEARGHGFRGSSDTEVLLAGFEEWGVRAAIERFIGMFAIAVWDSRERELHLVRDRLGLKPLFVYAQPGLVTFGSELKTLVAGPAFDREVDSQALAEYLRYLYVPAPRTMYRRTIKILPGHILTLRDAKAALPESVPYWSLEEASRRGLENPLTGSVEEVIEEAEELLRTAVRCRMRADVPLGAFLSGGIDSSLVTALLQEASADPVRTLSIAFAEAEYNEADHAAEVARHLGTNHAVLSVTGQDALDTVPRLPEMFDEPHADTSQIPAYLMCAVARNDVTVALSGDGGDEVFGGYNRYSFGEEMIGRLGRVPSPLRQWVGAGVQGVSPSTWNRAHQLLSPVLPGRYRQRQPGGKLNKLGGLMRQGSPIEMYRSLVSMWPDSDALVAAQTVHPDRFEEALGLGSSDRLLHRMLLADQITYLPDDQLAKVDRVSMAVSLEVRVPLVDHRLVEFSWRLDPSFKTRSGVGKWLLREVLYRHVPRELVDRPKMGLSVPIDEWLRGPLREWAEDLLSEEALARDRILHPAPIRRAWQELKNGRSEMGLGLWAVLLFQGWRERWLHR